MFDLPKKLNPFRWVDSEGIPLEMVVDAFARKGYAPDFIIMHFLLGAQRAGWKPETVKGVLREAMQIGMPTHPSLRQWLKYI